MRIVFPNGEDATPALSPEQVAAVDKVRERWNLPETVTVSPGFGGYVLVDVGSMVLGIERDGYTHS